MIRPRRRAAVTRLVVLILLLAAGIWFLYKTFIRIPPAPSPRVTTSQAVVLFRAPA